MESSNEYQKVNSYNSPFYNQIKRLCVFDGLYKSLQEKNAFFKSGRYIAYINTKLLGERFLRTRRRSKYTGNSQAKGL